MLQTFAESSSFSPVFFRSDHDLDCRCDKCSEDRIATAQRRLDFLSKLLSLAESDEDHDALARMIDEAQHV